MAHRDVSPASRDRSQDDEASVVRHVEVEVGRAVGGPSRRRLASLEGLAGPRAANDDVAVWHGQHEAGGTPLHEPAHERTLPVDRRPHRMDGLTVRRRKQPEQHLPLGRTRLPLRKVARPAEVRRLGRPGRHVKAAGVELVLAR